MHLHARVRHLVVVHVVSQYFVVGDLVKPELEFLHNCFVCKLAFMHHHWLRELGSLDEILWLQTELLLLLEHLDLLVLLGPYHFAEGGLAHAWEADGDHEILAGSHVVVLEQVVVELGLQVGGVDAGDVLLVLLLF